MADLEKDFTPFYESETRGATPIAIINPITEEIDDVLYSLPLSSRTIEEILEDHALEFSSRASINKSIKRRKKSRIDSKFVVEVLDTLDDTLKLVGFLAIKQMRVMHSPVLRQQDLPIGQVRK